MGKRTLTLKELTNELPRVLEFARVDRDYLVIVEHGPYYVQLAWPAGWILGEAVSNAYLPEGWKLDAHEEVMLDVLGWEPPHAVDRDGECHANFHRAWHDDTPSEEIAHDVLNTLIGVFMQGEDAAVELQVFDRGRQEDGSPYAGFGDCEPDGAEESRR